MRHTQPRSLPRAPASEERQRQPNARMGAKGPQKSEVRHSPIITSDHIVHRLIPFFHIVAHSVRGEVSDDGTDCARGTQEVLMCLQRDNPQGSQVLLSNQIRIVWVQQ
eukprot:3537635-Amphidinium_carterae.2